MVCNFGWSLSRGHSHTLSLFRMFADASVEWVFGRMNNDQDARNDQDLTGTGMIHYKNGIQGFLNHGGWLNIVLLATTVGLVREICMRTLKCGPDIHKQKNPYVWQFPNPKRPKSSQQSAIEGLVKNLQDGSQPLCSGEFGRRH